MSKNKGERLLRLQSLLETSKILNSRQDVDTILDTLLTKSLELIEGGDIGAIFLYNEKTEMLEMRTFKGMGETVKDVKLRPGESMTGITFQKKKAIFYRNTSSVEKAMATMSEENIKLAAKGNVFASGINSSICCPLIYKNKVIGVLVVDNIRDETSLKEEDVEFLKAISAQATTAIINAQNYKKELENNKKLEEYNKLIKDERNKYKYSTNIHTRFTEMVLNGSTINDIIMEIKNLSGKDIFILDLFYNLTYHTIEDKNKIYMINQKIPALIPLLNQEKVKYLGHENGIYYHIFPIMVNKETLGWLCAISKTSELAELDIITLERGTTILALEFYKKNEILDMEQSLKGDFLDSLLLNNDPEYIKKCSQRYGFNINSNHRIITIEFKLNSKVNNYEKEIKRSIKGYYRIINEKLKLYFPESISFIKRHMIVIIIETKTGKETDRIEKLINSVQKKCASTYFKNYKECNFRIGISDIFRGIDKFNQAFFNSIQALKMVGFNKGDKNYIYFEDLEIKKFLMNNDFAELKSFADKILGPLQKYKYASGNDFMETLRIYLQTNCNWTETKNKLHIHGNTLTYRLNRIRKILDLDFNNYYDRLRLMIAFEIIDLLDNSSFE